MSIKNRFMALLGIDTRSDEQIKAEINETMKSYFKDDATEQVDPEPQNPNIQPQEDVNKGAVMFAVTDGGELNIDVKWGKPSEALSQALGILLHYINTGCLEDKIRGIIQNAASANADSRPFLERIMHHWEQSHKKKDPVVKPSEVFRLGRQVIKRNVPKNSHIDASDGEES